MQENTYKLLAAFTLAAYKSKNCGNDLTREVRDNNMGLLGSYIRTGVQFPQKVIDMHPRLATEIKTQGIREYIYLGHFDVLKEADFEGLLSRPGGFIAANLCAPNYYTVLNVPPITNDSDFLIKARNVLTKEVKDLEVLAGLEVPSVGQLVSAHWRNFLEILTENPETNKWIELRKEYGEYTDNALRSLRSARRESELVGK